MRGRCQTATCMPQWGSAPAPEGCALAVSLTSGHTKPAPVNCYSTLLDSAALMPAVLGSGPCQRSFPGCIVGSTLYLGGSTRGSSAGHIIISIAPQRAALRGAASGAWSMHRQGRVGAAFATWCTCAQGACCCLRCRPGCLRHRVLAACQGRPPHHRPASINHRRAPPQAPQAGL